MCIYVCTCACKCDMCVYEGVCVVHTHSAISLEGTRVIHLRLTITNTAIYLTLYNHQLLSKLLTNTATPNDNNEYTV